MDASHALYEQGREVMVRGDFAQAAALFAQSVADCPHFKALELWGECLLLLGRLNEAVVPLAAATALNRGVCAPALLANVFLQLGQHTDAARMAGVALERDSHNRMAQSVMETLSRTGKEK